MIHTALEVNNQGLESLDLLPILLLLVNIYFVLSCARSLLLELLALPLSLLCVLSSIGHKLPLFLLGILDTLGRRLPVELAWVLLHPRLAHQWLRLHCLHLRMLGLLLLHM